ncbi:MAG: transcriptional regulator BetI [Inquilinus sp.]|nr:transcriptional regulator BetI [Inquilinus sp.]
MQQSKRSRDRQNELIEAALSVIGRAGSLDVSVSQIAGQAGVSSALAHHYFGSKEDLLFATQRHLLTLFRQDVVARLAAAPTPRARLSAIVEASFSPLQFNAGTVAAWTIFYLRAQSSRANSRLLQVYVARLRANLVHELRSLISETKIEAAAESIGAMIDGLYLRQGLRKGAADREAAIRITEHLIDTLVRS